MGFKIWIGKEYDNTHENQMAAEALEELRRVYADLEEECHALVNFSIPGDPPKAGERPYVSTIDLAVLKGHNLILVDLKNYHGRIEFSDTCKWICHAADRDVEISGGKEGRTPHGQLCDYRRQIIVLLASNLSQFLRSRKRTRPFDCRRFVSGMVLFPKAEKAEMDSGKFETECGRWLSVKRMDGFAAEVCARCGGRDADLDDYELGKLVAGVLRLQPAHLVGGIPKVGAADMAQVPGQVTIVTVEKPVEVRVEVSKVVRDEYGAIQLIYDSEDSNEQKVRDFSEVFRRAVGRERKRKFRETQVRSLGTAAEMLLADNPDLSRCAVRFFRLSAAIFHNRELRVSESDVKESYKTICRVVEKFSGEGMPAALQTACDAITYRPERGPQTTPTAERPLSLLLEVKSVDSEHFAIVGIDRTDDSGVEHRVVYSDGQDTFKDFGSLVEEGDIVCAVTPTRIEGAWKASEMVLEPDYLISPQAIGTAAEFGRPEYYFWLNVIKDDVQDKYRVPSPNEPMKMADHTLLGGFANACLAERCANGAQDYRALVLGFSSENILDLTDADPGTQTNVRGNWREQSEFVDGNIRHLLSHTLPGEHGKVGLEWQIEAPLYSPVYGLTARADALSYSGDRSEATVLELKSGKWDNFQGDRPKKEHLCQPSYYSDLLVFSAGINRTRVRSFLYYAKTILQNQWSPQRDGMLFVEPGTRARMQKYSMIRNAIVWLDKRMRDGRARQLVDALQVVDFRGADMNEGFFANYKSGEIQGMLNPLQAASDLEKRYFYRMLQFAAEESFASRLGDDGADVGRGGMALLWRLPVNQRRETGLRLSELVRVPGDGDVDSLDRLVCVTFDTTHDMYNSGCSIRVGDGVCLYADSNGTNITNSVVFAATVKDLTAKTVTLRLDDPQPVGLFGFSPTARYAVESAPMHGWSDYRCLWHFLTGDTRRRELVLNVGSPVADADASLPISVSIMEQQFPGVESWLKRAWQAKDYFLLWGPPGTGKTSYAMRALVAEARAANQTVLLLAYTYKATDKICEMLERAAFDYLRIGNPQKADPLYRSHIPEEMGVGTRDTVRQLINANRIYVGTVSTITPKHAICGLIKHFDLAIVDEASQLLDSHLLSLFCAKRQDSAAGPLVDKFIFIGDDRQLPAVVQQREITSRITDEDLLRQDIRDCRESFFARLKRKVGDDRRFCGMLDRQFRMHPMISDFCSQYFYDGRLKNGHAYHQSVGLPPPPPDAAPYDRYVLGTRLGFFPVTTSRVDGGKVNQAEAAVCVAVVKALLTHSCRPPEKDGGAVRDYAPDDIGILVPFRRQIACIRQALTDTFGEERASGISIDTVERKQGGEHPVVLFSTTISSADQADWMSAKRYDDDDDGDERADPIDRKLNVAITRAQERFYLIGNEHVLNNLRAYGDLLGWVSVHSGFCESGADELF